MTFAVDHEGPGILDLVFAETRVHRHRDLANAEDLTVVVLHFTAELSLKFQLVQVLLAHVPGPPEFRFRHGNGKINPIKTWHQRTFSFGGYCQAVEAFTTSVRLDRYILRFGSEVVDLHLDIDHGVRSVNLRLDPCGLNAGEPASPHSHWAPDPERNKARHVVTREAEFSPAYPAVVARWRIELDHQDVAALEPLFVPRLFRDIEGGRGIHALVPAQILTVEPGLEAVVHALEQQLDAPALHGLGDVEFADVPVLVLHRPAGLVHIAAHQQVIQLARALQVGVDIARHGSLIPIEIGALILGGQAVETFLHARARPDLFEFPVISAEVDLEIVFCHRRIMPVEACGNLTSTSYAMLLTIYN